MKNPTEIILHVIDSDNPNHDNIETIDAWHRSRKPPFKMIGYHRYVNRFGERFEGRPLRMMGAHTKGNNYNTLSIATFGKFGTVRTQPQFKGIIDEIVELKAMFPSIIKVSQHSIYEPKKPHCAGFNESQMSYFNILVK